MPPSAKWDRLRFLSAEHCTYTPDYFSNTKLVSDDLRRANHVPDKEVWEEPVMNVFRRDDGTIRHFWGSELAYAPSR